MKPTRIFAKVVTCSGFLLLSGCAEGPFPKLAELNPYYRRQWQEDEQYAQTFHSKRLEIRELAAKAESASADEKSRIADMFCERLQVESNSVLRQELIRGLGKCGGPTAYETLSIQIGDLDEGVRMAACQAFGDLKSDDAANALANVIVHDKNLDVRLTAAQMLANFTNNAIAIRALAPALDDSNPAMQFRAVKSLQSITGRDLGNNVVAWRDYVNSGGVTGQRQEPSLVQRLKNWF